MLVPGLTDGLLALDYVPALAAALDRLGYSFVQPILSSSYKGAVPQLAGAFRPALYKQRNANTMDEFVGRNSSAGLL